jgi:hypothetical protein
MGPHLRPTDINDPATGQPLYVLCVDHCRAWYHWQRLQLFFGILWRRYEGTRMSWSLSWEIARGMYAAELDRPTAGKGEG